MPRLTQGRRLIMALKRRPRTYMEMLLLGISTCPQKRIVESLRPGEVIRREKNRRGLVCWSVAKRAEGA